MCKKLDLGSKVALVRCADLKYYTKTRDFTDVHVVGGRSAYPVRVNILHAVAIHAMLCACMVHDYLGVGSLWRLLSCLFEI